MDKDARKGGATLSLCHSATHTDRTFEGDSDVVVDRRNKFRKRIHITKIGHRLHVFEIPAADGSPLKWRGGPFDSELAAELFREELAEACAFGDVKLRRFEKDSRGPEHYDEWARIVAFMEDGQRCIDPSDLRSLARDLCIDRPWEMCDRSQPQSGGCESDDMIPF